jgi:hypothetical protein
MSFPPVWQSRQRPTYRADDAIHCEADGERDGETHSQRHCELGSPVGGDYLIHNFVLPIRRFPFKLWWHLSGLNALNLEHFTLLHFG